MLARQNTTAGSPAEQTRLEEEAWVRGGPRPSAHDRLVRTHEAAVETLRQAAIHLTRVEAMTKSPFPQHMRDVEEQQAKLTGEIDAVIALLERLKAQ